MEADMPTCVQPLPASGASTVDEVCARIRACDSKLLSIELEGKGVSEADILRVMNEIKAAPVVAARSFSIAGTEVGDSAVQKLYTTLYALPHLTHLNISRTAVDEHTLAMLSNYVRTSFNLLSVHASQTAINCSDAMPEDLCPGCQYATVNVHYYLHCNRTLADVLRGNGNSVLLASRKLDSLPAALLKPAVFRALRSLSLPNNQFTEIPSSLNEMECLEHLDMASNSITSIAKFCAAPHPSLVALLLDDNLLDGSEVERIGTAQEHFPKLKFLDVRSNAILSISAALASFGKFNRAMKHVFVSSNPLVDEKNASDTTRRALRLDGAAVLAASKQQAPTTPVPSTMWVPASPIPFPSSSCTPGQLSYGIPTGMCDAPPSLLPTTYKLILKEAHVSEWRRPRLPAVVHVRYRILSSEAEVHTWSDRVRTGAFEQHAGELDSLSFRLLHHVAPGGMERCIRTMLTGEVALVRLVGSSNPCPSYFRPIVSEKDARCDQVALIVLDDWCERISLCDKTGCMQKRTLKLPPPRTAASTPRCTSSCRIHYCIRAPCGLLLFPKRSDESDAQSNVITLSMSCKRTPEFFKMAILSMEAGEIAQFTICSKWLSSGLLPCRDVQCHQNLVDVAPQLVLDVHLIHVSNPPPRTADSPSHRLMQVRQKQQRGVTALKRDDLDMASQCFTEAVAELQLLEADSAVTAKASLHNDIRMLKQESHINLAAVSIRRKDYHAALRYCAQDGTDKVPAGPFRSQARFACVCLKEGAVDVAAEVIDKYLAIQDTLNDCEQSVLSKLDERRRRLQNRR